MSVLGRDTLPPAKALAGKLSDLFAFGLFVAFFNRFLFGDVLTLLRFTVKARAFPVKNMRLGVDPYESVRTTGGWCWSSRRLGCPCASRSWSGGSCRAS